MWGSKVMKWSGVCKILVFNHLKAHILILLTSVAQLPNSEGLRIPTAHSSVYSFKFFYNFKISGFKQ